MKISKTFYWEMGHRLPFHQGKCINLHGHSYRAEVMFEGDPDTNGMLIDFYELKKIVAPLVEQLDHAFMVNESDTKLIALLKEMNSKMYVCPFHSTAENITLLFLNEIKKSGLPETIKNVTVRVYETTDSFAEASF
jgi:6-pyruvoyltetrahydropterin/6-carboxytetrahydropterin synthase